VVPTFLYRRGTPTPHAPADRDVPPPPVAWDRHVCASAPAAAAARLAGAERGTSRFFGAFSGPAPG